MITPIAAATPATEAATAASNDKNKNKRRNCSTKQKLKGGSGDTTKMKKPETITTRDTCEGAGDGRYRAHGVG